MFDFLNEMGKAFHNVGAATEKDLSLKDVGSTSSNSHEELQVVIHHMHSNPINLRLGTANDIRVSYYFSRAPVTFPFWSGSKNKPCFPSAY